MPLTIYGIKKDGLLNTDRTNFLPSPQISGNQAFTPEVEIPSNQGYLPGEQTPSEPEQYTDLDLAIYMVNKWEPGKRIASLNEGKVFTKEETLNEIRNQTRFGLTIIDMYTKLFSYYPSKRPGIGGIR